MSLNIDAKKTFETIYSSSNVNVRLDGTFKRASADGIDVIYDCDAFYKNAPADEQVFLGVANGEISASELIGHYIIIAIASEVVQIYRSYYGRTRVFYTCQSGILICDDFETICIGIPLSANVDRNYAGNYICGRNLYCGSTLHKLIKIVEPGEHIILRHGYPPMTEAIDIPPMVVEALPELLVSNCRNYGARARTVELMFSGGLDSTILMAALSEASIPYEAIHVLPLESERSTELQEAREVAATFNKEVITRSGVLSLQRGRPQSPDGMPFFREDGRPILGSDRSRTIFMGHGGDHVFGQNPSQLVGVDAFYERGIASAWEALRKHCTLKAQPSLSAILENLFYLLKPDPAKAVEVAQPAWLAKQRSSGIRHMHPALQRYYRRPAKFKHMLAYLDAVHSIPQGGRNTIVCPLLLQNIAGVMLNTPVKDLYSAHYDRALVRESCRSFFQKNVFHRRTKRSSSERIFREFRERAAEVAELFNNGQLVADLGLDLTKIRQDIDYNATVQIAPSLQSILRLYQLQAFYQYMAARSANE